MADTLTTTHIGDLRPDPANARKHNPRNIGMIAESLQQYGPGRSITIDEANMLLTGHGVVEAAMQIGIEWVRVYDRTTGEMEPPPPDGAQYITAVRISDLTPEQKKLYAIADNRTTDLSDFAPDVLQAFIDDGLDLEQFWFPEELAEVLAGDAVDVPGLTDPDDVPEPPADPITKPGDVWLLGEHRLLCGDSTSATDMDTLLAGVRPSLALTSFPYGVGLDYGDTYTDDIENLRTLLRDVPPLVYGHLADGAYFVTNFADVISAWKFLKTDEPCEYPVSELYWPAFRECEFLLHTRRIWAKPHARVSAPWTSNSNRAACDWEHIWTWKKPGRSLNERREPSYFGVWDSAKLEGVDIGKETHPAAFPVGIASHIIGIYSNAGQSVLEPFCGTGTTIIACEQTGRTCYGMEISPAYCDVIVTRWEQFTGNTATRETPALHDQAAD